MELLLMVGPSVVALGLLYLAWDRARTKAGVKASPMRLFASYLLLLPAFAVGSCWGILGHAGFGDSSGTRLREACYVSAIALVAITGSYLVRCVRSAPVSGGDASAGPDRRALAVLGVVVAFALTIALLGAAWLG